MMSQKISIKEVQLFERDITLRLPFKFGAVTLTQAPQAFVRCRIELETGEMSWGMSAEMMAPKWFDKNPALTNDQNIDQLRSALHLYRDAILGNGTETAFGHYASLYNSHLSAGDNLGLNPITASFGPALIDRAVIDALCRANSISFATAMQNNLAGIQPGVLLPEFIGFNFDQFLSTLKPATQLHARHTVGMADPLNHYDQPLASRLNDGLPETLEDVIKTYGITYFKIKVGGNLNEDINRLKDIARILDTSPTPYLATLDGNEQYDNVDGVIELLRMMKGDADLKRLCSSTLFIEQPIQRATALERDVSTLANDFPVIIDESDADLSAFPLARQKGYSGVSSKSCKGFYKSLINLARCQIWSEQDNKPYFMSAEDLTSQAGVSVQQDLALVALLNLGHVERNGHHYVHGMAGADEEEKSRFIEAHPDLYDRKNGQVCIRIEDGMLATGSLQCTGYGVGAEPDWTNMKPIIR